MPKFEMGPTERGYQEGFAAGRAQGKREGARRERRAMLRALRPFGVWLDPHPDAPDDAVRAEVVTVDWLRAWAAERTRRKGK